jgi:ABC-type polysaccharide/polyol phosphate transport system ATPase subunit
MITGIIGRNGAGKTTLLNIIAGVLSPTEGEVLVKGRALGLFNLGVGFQDELTGKENIFLNGALLGAPRKELSDKFDSIVEFSELGEFIGMPLGTYSQGMRLRLGFSIIANLDFDILAIDEVLAVGDVLFQNKCFQRLTDFRHQGKTLIITNQNLDLIERLCDQVALLDHGRLVFFGNAQEAISGYRRLLNTERFYVGSGICPGAQLTETKKWSDDRASWGKSFGTKEAVIDSVRFLNRWGIPCKKVASGVPLRIRVGFIAKGNIKEPHFGVAIFREDGVYCYGPNTAFDGHEIPVIKPGKGWFELRLDRLLLAPGDYKLSVAIWDKNETVAFDYHHACYGLTVTGDHIGSDLLNLGLEIISNKEKENIVESVPGKLRISSMQLLDEGGGEKETFCTNERVSLKFRVEGEQKARENHRLWFGLFRDDGVYCQGREVFLNGSDTVEVLLPELPLLPGGYRVSSAITASGAEIPPRIFECERSFRMVFDKEDHGTVYLKHGWSWRLPD